MIALITALLKTLQRATCHHVWEFHKTVAPQTALGRAVQMRCAYCVATTIIHCPKLRQE